MNHSTEHDGAEVDDEEKFSTDDHIKVQSQHAIAPQSDNLNQTSFETASNITRNEFKSLQLRRKFEETLRDFNVRKT